MAWIFFQLWPSLRRLDLDFISFIHAYLVFWWLNLSMNCSSLVHRNFSWRLPWPNKLRFVLRSYWCANISIYNKRNINCCLQADGSDRPGVGGAVGPHLYTGPARNHRGAELPQRAGRQTGGLLAGTALSQLTGVRHHHCTRLPDHTICPENQLPWYCW